jgi:hypothetical protein
MATRLPLNRKERFFTGTVLPVILCSENFSRLPTFLSLVEGFPQLELKPHPESANFQFFTEYSLAESIFGSIVAKWKWQGDLGQKPTPDVLILVEGDQPVLLTVEAKMYHRPTPAAMKLQLDQQRNLLSYIAANLELPETSVFHVALLPAGLSAELGDVGVPKVTWEQVLAALAPSEQDDDYFLRVLRLSLEAYPELVSRRSEYGKNAEDKLKGGEIYARFHAGDRKYLSMGRQLGFKGGQLEEDVNTHAWVQQRYEVSSKPPPNTNWFLIERFVELVDAVDPVTASAVPAG